MEPLSIKQYWYFLIHICGYYIAKGYIIFFTGNQQHKLSFLPTSHQQQIVCTTGHKQNLLFFTGHQQQIVFSQEHGIPQTRLFTNFL
jgi:hypothetical protein